MSTRKKLDTFIDSATPITLLTAMWFLMIVMALRLVYGGGCD